METIRINQRNNAAFCSEAISRDQYSGCLKRVSNRLLHQCAPSNDVILVSHVIDAAEKHAARSSGERAFKVRCDMRKSFCVKIIRNLLSSVNIFRVIVESKLSLLIERNVVIKLYRFKRNMLYSFYGRNKARNKCLDLKKDFLLNFQVRVQIQQNGLESGLDSSTIQV